MINAALQHLVDRYKDLLEWHQNAATGLLPYRPSACASAVCTRSFFSSLLSVFPRVPPVLGRGTGAGVGGRVVDVGVDAGAGADGVGADGAGVGVGMEGVQATNASVLGVIWRDVARVDRMAA